MSKQTKLILASASPRRRELLERAGVSFEVVSAEINENPKEGESSTELVMRLALEKAQAVAIDFLDRVVLAADTIVTFSGKDGEIIYGKPSNDTEAHEMLQQLQGKTHQVQSGYCLLKGEAKVVRAVSTDVTMTKMSEDEISWYIKSGEPKGKAGAYAIQGIGGSFVKTINGSYTNVVGLPVAEVLEELSNFDS